jgi:mannose-6-phosphate isomerase-like protein (cupin superfamily)
MPAWFVPGPPPAEFYSDEGCYITEILNRDESPDASLALARVRPGVTTRLHALEGIVERYVILSGEGRAEVGGVSAPVRPGDVVVIAAGVPQRITSTGATDLAFHCLCTPRFRPEAYRELTAPARRSPG